MHSVVILLSGGLDSTTLLFDLRRRVEGSRLHALTFRYGQTHARETECAAAQARAAGVAVHRVVDLPGFAALVAGASDLTGPPAGIPALDRLAAADLDQPPTYVPHRNLVLLSLAAAYAEAHGLAEVFYAAQAQDRYGYWDCTAAFLDRLNAVLALNRRVAVAVRAPFLALPKRAIVALGLRLGVDYGRTWTCYRGGERPCGECPSCVERAAAFAALGKPDPLSPAR